MHQLISILICSLLLRFLNHMNWLSWVLNHSSHLILMMIRCTCISYTLLSQLLLLNIVILLLDLLLVLLLLKHKSFLFSSFLFSCLLLPSSFIFWSWGCLCPSIFHIWLTFSKMKSIKWWICCFLSRWSYNFFNRSFLFQRWRWRFCFLYRRRNNFRFWRWWLWFNFFLFWFLFYNRYNLC